MESLLLISKLSVFLMLEGQLNTLNLVEDHSETEQDNVNTSF